jgi:acyl carrier protein
MKQDTTTIEGVITDALTEIGIDTSRISLDARLTDLEVDSLDLAELSQIISDRFGVEIVAADAPRLQTVGDLVTLIEARR